MEIAQGDEAVLDTGDHRLGYNTVLAAGERGYVTDPEPDNVPNDSDNVPPPVDLTDPKKYKVKHRGPALRMIEAGACILVEYLPLSISPNVLTIICLFIRLFGLIWIYYDSACYETPKYEPYPRCVADHSGSYAVWSLTVFIGWLLDVMDGHHARRSKQQCPLRHLFDHACDVFDYAVASFVFVLIAPLRVHLPIVTYVYLYNMTFFLGFLLYSLNGVMIIPVVEETNMYLNIFFFGLASAYGGGYIWVDDDTMYTCYAVGYGILVTLWVGYLLYFTYRIILGFWEYGNVFNLRSPVIRVAILGVVVLVWEVSVNVIERPVATRDFEEKYMFIQLVGVTVGLAMAEVSLDVMTNHLDRSILISNTSVMSIYTIQLVCIGALFLEAMTEKHIKILSGVTFFVILYSVARWMRTFRKMIKQQNPVVFAFFCKPPATEADPLMSEKQQLRPLTGTLRSDTVRQYH